MRREERRDLPMEWMRVRDSSSSFRISIFERNDYRGGALSLSHSLVLSSHLAETRKEKGEGGRKGERKEGREGYDMRGPSVSGNFANKTLPLFNID
jgi:hypothetical protein